MNTSGKLGVVKAWLTYNNVWVRQKNIANFTMSLQEDGEGGDSQNIHDINFSSNAGSSFSVPDEVLSQDSLEGLVDPKELMVRHEHLHIVYSTSTLWG